MKRNVISIEGNIGSGKSTLLESLKNKYASNPRVVFLDEPVTMWDSIRDQEGITMLEVLQRPRKVFVSFSNDGIYFTPACMKDAIAKNPHCIFITERCLH